MSQGALQVVAAAGFAATAVGVAWRLRLGLSRELAWAAVRAAVQLTVVGALIALVFRVEELAFAFVAAVVLVANGVIEILCPHTAVETLAGIALRKRAIFRWTVAVS